MKLQCLLTPFWDVTRPSKASGKKRKEKKLIASEPVLTISNQNESNCSINHHQNHSNQINSMAKPKKPSITDTNVANSKNLPAVVSPLKKAPKRIKIKRSDASTKIMGGGCQKQALLTETIGMGDHIVLTVEHRPSTDGGFMAPLVQESKKKEFQSRAFQAHMFDCHSNANHFLRKNHESNERVPVGKISKDGKMHNKTAISCEPAVEMLENGFCTVKVEKAFRDECLRLLEFASGGRMKA